MEINEGNKNSKVGIKHPKFTMDGENGQSHRKNRERKKLQYLRNTRTRAALYSKFQGENRGSAAEFHAGLAALSMGTA
ncbi:MAG: hypothetical protein NTZ20_05305 [Candidatus Levybacteria bacterium]|nr:hypothetical protein [Candidatus Levybacteria bacterium]